MARNCCLIVWDYEQDLKLLAHEEKYFNAIHIQFMKRADVFKVHAKRVYKSLNVLWYSGKSMDDTDSRKGKCLDTVARISMHWMYADQVLCKEIEGLSMYSKNVNPDALRQVLQNMMAKVSAIDAQVNCQMIWDADCAAKIKGAFKEIVPRANRLLDGDWIFRYFCYFGKANDILMESEKQVDAFFRQTFGCMPEDFPTDANGHRDNAKPPHEVAFNHVAQIISSRFLDTDRAQLEPLDLSVPKTASVPAVAAIPDDNPAEDIAPNYDQLPQLLEKSIADAPDNVALAIERVVAGYSQTPEPECVDLTDSPPQSTSTAAPPVPLRKRLAVQEGFAQPTIVRQLLMGEKAVPTAKGVVKKPLISSTKPANSSGPGLSTSKTRPTAATPTSHGVADSPTESDRATVQRPSVQRFLYVRSQKQNVDGAELAANKLRLGFGDDEGAVNVRGALFERFYRPDGPAVHQRKQFDALLPESATGAGTHDKEGAANGESSSCVSRPAGKCTGHVVRMKPVTGVVKATRAVEGVADVAAATRKFLAVNEPVVVKPGRVVEAVDKTTAFKFVGNPAARRRYVTNGRQPFKEIRPAVPKTVDVVAGKPDDVPRASPSVGDVRVSRMDCRFTPYKLELHGGDTVLGKATVTSGALQETATKKYDFRSRVRDGREGNDGKMEEQGFLMPTIKMRKDLYSKQQGPK